MDKISKITDRYSEAGVSIDSANRLVDLIRPYINKTFKPGVISDIGGYSGLFSLRNLDDIEEPVLVASSDGVGTKLKIAFMMDKHDTVGIDLVAMCVNDIIVQGAIPLFMLDYLAMGRLDVDKATQIIKGICKGCEEANCSLIGGETAEMPSMYKDGEYDLAGFVVGIVDNKKIIDGSDISVGNQLIGIRSSGLHSNGYSLVRKIFFDELNIRVEDYIPEFGRTLGEELLEPTKIYVKLIERVKRDFHIYGIVHITGGGFLENIPRILPKRCKAVIKKSAWEPHPIFRFVQEMGKISEIEMMRVFNNGIGMILVVNKNEVEEIIGRIKGMGEDAYHIGWIETREEKEDPVQFIE